LCGCPSSSSTNQLLKTNSQITACAPVVHGLSLSRLFVLSLVCAYEPLDSLFFNVIFLCMSFSGLYEKISSADLKSFKPGQTQNEVNFRHTIHRFSIHNFFRVLISSNFPFVFAWGRMLKFICWSRFKTTTTTTKHTALLAAPYASYAL
jgi:hypothetical protein